MSSEEFFKIIVEEEYGYTTKVLTDSMIQAISAIMNRYADLRVKEHIDLEKKKEDRLKAFNKQFPHHKTERKRDNLLVSNDKGTWLLVDFFTKMDGDCIAIHGETIFFNPVSKECPIMWTFFKDTDEIIFV